MKSEELFKGFSVGAGKDRFNDGFTRYGTTIDCKVSGSYRWRNVCFRGEQHGMAAPRQQRPGRMDLRP